MGEDLDRTVLPDGMIAFPDPAAVFSGDVAAHRRVLQPLASIPADWADRSWRGMLHFVAPIEPYEGLLGEETTEFHSGYCRTNWIGFRVESGKYTFLGDFRFFRINKTFDGEHALANKQYWEDYYSKTEASFAEVKANFERTGKLHRRNYRPSPWLTTLGGESAAGNWASDRRVETVVGRDGREVAFPLTEDGRRFRFVGEVRGGAFRKNGADGVLLFLDPETQIALLTFEWT